MRGCAIVLFSIFVVVPSWSAGTYDHRCSGNKEEGQYISTVDVLIERIDEAVPSGALVAVCIITQRLVDKRYQRTNYQIGIEKAPNQADILVSGAVINFREKFVLRRWRVFHDVSDLQIQQEGERSLDFLKRIAITYGAPDEGGTLTWLELRIISH